MTSAYIGEIRLFGGGYAPRGWVMCEGEFVSIQGHEELFELIGTTYGGDGKSNFRLPDLRGRIPIHVGTNPDTGSTYKLGQEGGTREAMLTVNHLPRHTHAAQASANDGTLESPAGAVWAKPGANQYAAPPATRDMHPDAIGAAGAGETVTHNNLMPYLGLNFIISLVGLPPDQRDGEATLAEIRLFTDDKRREGWLPCDGQELRIADYQALYSLLGTRFGGDDRTTFKLPDLRGRAPVHRGNDVALGQKGGKEWHVLEQAEMPSHTHQVSAYGQTGNASFPTPSAATARGFVWAASDKNPYANMPSTKLHPSAISEAGAGQPHANMQPYRALVFCIAIRGIYPVRQ